ncbi:MAG: hypothetical protein ACOX7H_02785 [Bacillota bacterium]
MDWLIFFGALIVIIIIYPTTIEIQFNIDGKDTKTDIYFLPLSFLSINWRIKLPVNKLTSEGHKSLKDRLKEQKLLLFKHSLPTFKKFLPSIYWRKMEIIFYAGYENATVTAMLAATLTITAKSIMAVIFTDSKGYKNYPLININPLFGQNKVHGSIDCIFSMRTGNIIINVIKIIKLRRKEKKNVRGM